MSEREPIPTISGSEGVPDQQELKWAFPDVSPGQKPYGGRVVVQLRRIKKTTASKIILVSETKETEKWQNMIGYVPQTITLLDDSIRRNIAFGIPETEIDEEKIKKSINLAHLSSFISELEEGTETAVGERGVKLSGGQRQRIGLARALYNDPPVLVLDEATSALDKNTEDEVMQAIRELKGNKTILIIAHRTSTIAHCDLLFMIDGGSVSKVGPPENFSL